MENNQINEIVETALSNLQRVAEVNTIVGKPLVTVDGTTIVPVSQITFAFMAGGGASMVPVGFLVIDRDGVRMMDIDNASVLDKIVDVARTFVGQ